MDLSQLSDGVEQTGGMGFNPKMPPVSVIVRVIACLVLAWQPSSVLAADEDTQLWIYAITTGEIGDSTTLTADATARWREDARGDEQQTLRVNIMHAVSDAVSIGGGAGIFEAGGSTELRPHQQIDLKLCRFSSRTRLEQRFVDGADRMGMRLRQRLSYAQPVSTRLTARLDAEYLNIVRSTSRGENQARGQWRGRILLSASLNERLSMGAAYLYIHTPRPNADDRTNHVPQAIMTYRF